MSVFTHPAAAKDPEFAGTQQDTLTSFIKASGELVKAKAERDQALATIGRVKALHHISPEHFEGCGRSCEDCHQVWPCSTIAALEPRS